MTTHPDYFKVACEITRAYKEVFMAPETEPMTVTKAFSILERAWSKVSFNINFEVWRHAHHDQADQIDPEWSVYHAENHKHYKHPTLAGALRSALADTLPATRIALSEADAALLGPCAFCAEPRLAGLVHYCSEAFARSEARRMAGEPS